MRDRPVTRARIEFGEALRRARLARGYSQTELQRVTGVHQSVISRLENGRMVGVRFHRLVRLLDGLGVEDIQFSARRRTIAGYDLA